MLNSWFSGKNGYVNFQFWEIVHIFVRLLAVFAVPIHSVNEDGTYMEEEEGHAFMHACSQIIKTQRCLYMFTCMGTVTEVK